MLEFNDTYRVGHEILDNIHEEFLELLRRALEQSGDAFDEAYVELMRHTKDHFTYEERQMEAVALASRREHCDEHRRILSEMEFFYQKALGGRRSFARAYLRDQLPHWLRQHTATMDADLAARLK